MNGAQAQKSFKTGEIIMRQGDEGKCAYIIEEGLVEILLEKPDGTSQQVSTRGEGSLIGEMAIVDEAPRTATVKALKDCKMLEISREDFSQRLKGTDPVIQMVSQVILTRYRDMLTRSDILHESENYPPPEAIERSYTEQTDVIESIKISNKFKAALKNGDLEMHYQPIIDLSRGSVIGFEALMRWTHKKDGMIPPDIFIPIAEKSGFIVEATKWATKESCQALKRIETALKKSGSLYMSVNFSNHDFAEKDFTSTLLKTVKDSKIEPRQIKLEITERLLITQPDNAKEKLQACRDAGMGIAIDDFGTGYSSLSYLYYFPIETLKIDQSFIRAMHKEDRSLELVKSIVGLGKNMGLNIIAEGVERIEEARILQDMGCDNAQGFYFAKPMSEKNVIKELLLWEPAKIKA